MKKSVLITTAFLFVGLFSISASAQKCDLDRASGQDVPTSGGFSVVEKGDYKKVAGAVSGANGEGVSGAHVALFRIEDGKETFIGSHKADDKGKFCLEGMPEGTYVLRAGAQGMKGVEFKFTYKPNKEWASQNKIKIALS